MGDRGFPSPPTPSTIELRLLGKVSARVEPGREVSALLAQPKRVALLAYLAAATPRGFHRRDALLALFWPEADQEHARASLRKSVHFLRQQLGTEVVVSRGDEEIGLDPARCWCDVGAFEESLAAGQWEAAAGLYRGDLLPGLHLSEVPEFERWLDETRTRLRTQAVGAAWQLAESGRVQGRVSQAVGWARRAIELSPYDEEGIRRLLNLLLKAGDRVGAVQAYEQFAQRLKADLELEPSAETVALVESVRARQPASGQERAAAVAPSFAVPPPPDSEPKPERRHLSFRPTLAVWMVATAVLIAGAIRRARPPDLAPHRVAAALFENRTGEQRLDALGTMAADWIVRGLLETPLVDVTDLEAVYAGGRDTSDRWRDPRALAREDSAGMLISGSYFRSGDSVLFQARIADVASGRILRSFDPVGAPVGKATAALQALQDEVTGGLAMLLNPAFAPVEPDMSPPKLSAYREFMAGLKRESWNDWKTAVGHYRRAAELDSTFIAPVVQLAFTSLWAAGDCALTDSLAASLDRRRDQLTPWNRITIDVERSRCRGDNQAAVRLLGQRSVAYPDSKSAQWQYAWALVHSNQPRAARELLGRLDPDRDCKGDAHRCMGWFSGNARSEYWSLVAASDHILGDHRAELAITDRWRDSTEPRWLVVRGRALGALGWEREVFEFLRSLTTRSIDSVVHPSLTMADELVVHGHRKTGIAVAESVLARLELTPDVDSSRAGYIVWANQLLGRKEAELAALRKLAWSTPTALRSIGQIDSILMLDARGRLAVLLGDTAQAERVDSMLAQQGRTGLRHPWIRGGLIMGEAHIAAGLGRRDRAVALLKDASARGVLELGSSFAWHQDPLLTSLRGYPPFEALLRPDN